MNRRKSIALLLAVAAVNVAFLLTGCTRYADDASDTLFQETKASTLLQKYTWFKDAAATLDARRATIKQFETKIVRLDAQYKGVKRSDWAREDAATYNQWEGELDGLKASYNDLASQYNAAMARENWAFCNVGSMPRGLDNQPPMSREIAPYLDGQGAALSGTTP